jgi:ribosomal RNA-processing protein 7
MSSVRSKGQKWSSKITTSEKTTLDALEDINHFKVFPLTITEDLVHYLYFKKHDDGQRTNLNDEALIDANKENKREHWAPNRTLFVINLPLGMSVAKMKDLFEREGCGHVAGVYFRKVLFPHHVNDDSIEEERQDIEEDELYENEVLTDDMTQLRAWKEQEPILSRFGRDIGAYVVFDHEHSLMRALNLRKKKRTWRGIEEPSDDTLFGLNRYRQWYQRRRPSPEELQQLVDTFMEDFDEKRIKERETAEIAARKPDEEGFVKVVRTGKRRATHRQGNLTVTAARLAVIKKQVPKTKSLTNFYRFQVREAKEQRLNELKQKFEQDKRRISLMKRSRQLRPF